MYGLSQPPRGAKRYLGLGGQLANGQARLRQRHRLEGHPLHLEPGLDQWFAWRPLLGYARYRMPLAGLYLCGSGAHPGGGVTGLPGRNAARAIIADAKLAAGQGILRDVIARS